MKYEIEPKPQSAPEYPQLRRHTCRSPGMGELVVLFTGLDTGVVLVDENPDLGTSRAGTVMRNLMPITSDTWGPVSITLTS